MVSDRLRIIMPKTQGNIYLALNECMHFSDTEIKILKKKTAYKAEYLKLC